MLKSPVTSLTIQRLQFALAFFVLIIVSMGLLGHDAASAATAQMVKDIAPPEQRVPARIFSIQSVGQQKALVEFVPDVPLLSPEENWVVDRASGQFSRLENDDALRPLSGMSHISDTSLQVGDTLYFAPAYGSTQTGLWKTDGTVGGTTQIHDLDGQMVIPRKFADADGSFYFYTGASTASAAQLWRSDGTSQGTRAIKVVPWPLEIAFSWLEWSAFANGTIYFLGVDPNAGLQLWKSDGTAEGTVAVKTIFPEQRGYPDILIGAGEKVFFSVPSSGCSAWVCSSLDRVLWVSDGTDSGTQPIKEFRGGSNGSGFVFQGLELNGELLFNARDAENGSKLWKTDGTVAGTVALGPDVYAPVIFRNALYSAFEQRYPGVDASGEPTPFIGPTSETHELKVVGDKLFLSDRDGTLWVSDGTPNGGHRLMNAADAGGEEIETITDAAGTALFSVTDSRTGFSQLWSSDGTVAGTVRLSVGGPAGSSHPSRLVGSTERLAFKAFDESGNRRLWLSDGTGPGTIALPGTRTGATPIYETPLAELGGRTLFWVREFDEYGSTLWSTDGSKGTSVPLGVEFDSRLFNIEPSVVNAVFKNALVFRGQIPATGDLRPSARGLWRSDGTPAGTSLIMEFSEDGLSEPRDFVTAGDVLFFLNGGDELWITDGTTVGTKLVSRFAESPAGDPLSLTGAVTVGRILYFKGRTDRGGFALWRSDGTPEGTDQVYDFNPDGYAYINDMMVVDERIYLSVFDDAATRLWQSDGTPNGTTVTELSRPNSLVAALNGALLLSQPDSNGRGSALIALATTDGTLTRTQSLRSFRSIWPAQTIAVGSVVYFTADDGIHGIELWRTDGTAEGTVMVQDIAPGTASSRPAELVVARNNLFFSADDSTNGRELWTLPLDDTAGNAGATPAQADGGGGGAISGVALFAMSLLLSLRQQRRCFSGRRSPIVAFALLHKIAVAIALLTGMWAICFPTITSAATAQMVKDIAPPEQNVPTNINGITPLGDRRVVVRHERIVDKQSTLEYWVLNYLTGEQALLADGTLQPDGPILAAGESLFFTARDRDGRWGLWKADETTSTATRLHDFEDIGSIRDGFVQMGATFYFRVETWDTAGRHARLWKSDGTPSGTTMVADVPPSANSFVTVSGLPGTAQAPSWGAALHGKLVFLGQDKERGVELWVSDGTAAGTVTLRSIETDASTSVQLAIAPNERLYFATTPTNCAPGTCSRPEAALWTSDGTVEGTLLLKEFVGDSSKRGSIGQLAVAGSNVIFDAHDATNGQKTWVSDGTAAGTVLFDFPTPEVWTELHGLLYFYADSDLNRRLWKTDGTNAGTSIVAEVSPVIGEMVTVGDRIYFTGVTNGRIYGTDGSAAGTREISTALSDERSRQWGLTNASGRLIFARSAGGGSEIWSSDGTDAGTVRHDSGPFGSSDPANIVVANERVYFGAYGGGGNRRLWVSDGSPSGTVQVQPSTPERDRTFEVAFGTVDTRTIFASYNDADSELKAVDGLTNQVSTVQKDLTAFTDPQIVGGNPVLFKGTLFFSGLGPDATSQFGRSYGLWRSDGTDSGSVLVKGCEQDGVCSPSFLPEAGDYLYFTTYIDGPLLWRTDGTPAGTIVLTSTLRFPPLPFATVAHGSVLYFFAHDDAGDFSLWTSDGTPETTAKVAVLSQLDILHVYDIVKIGDRIFFTASNKTDMMLWTSDGTASGTRPLNLSPITVPSFPLVEFAGSLLLPIIDSNSQGSDLEVVKTTDPESGFVRLGSVRSIKWDSTLVTRNFVFFAADDGIHGTELWQTDGTPEGTKMVEDIAPGPASSDPTEMTVAGNQLFFAADDSVNGRELWVVPLDAAGENSPNSPEQPSGGGGGGSTPASVVAGLIIAFLMRRRNARTMTA